MNEITKENEFVELSKLLSKLEDKIEGLESSKEKNMSDVVYKYMHKAMKDFLDKHYGEEQGYFHKFDLLCPGDIFYIVDDNTVFELMKVSGRDYELNYDGYTAVILKENGYDQFMLVDDLWEDIKHNNIDTEEQ